MCPRYDPLNKFMLLKHFDCSIAQPPRVFEMIITPDLEYPIGQLIPGSKGHFLNRFDHFCGMLSIAT